MAATNVQAFSGDVEITSNVTAADSKFSLDTNGTLKQFGNNNSNYIKLMKYFGSASNWKIATGTYSGNAYQWLSIRAKMTRVNQDVEIIQFNYFGSGGNSRVRDPVIIGGENAGIQANEIKVYNRESNSTYEIYLQIDNLTSVEVEITHRNSTIDDDYSTVATANNGAIDETGLTKIYDSGTTTDLRLKEGNVGIGTTDPDCNLEIYGSTSSIKATRAANSVNFGTTLDFALLNSANEKFTYARITGAIADNTDGSEDGFLSLQVGTNGNLRSNYEEEKMRILSDGNVGIGTNDPSHGRVQILCSSQTPSGGLTIRGGDFNAGLGAMWVEGGGNGQRFNIQAYKNENTNPPSGTNPSVLDADVFELCLNPTGGNVGVGTTNPDKAAHLYYATTVQTNGLLIENMNPASGTASTYFCVASSGEGAQGKPKAAIMYERTAANGQGKLLLCVDASNDNNEVGPTDSLITLKHNYYVGFGLNLEPAQHFHFARETEDDHLYVQYGKSRNNITSGGYWKPYMYAPGNTSSGTYAGTTYYSNSMFIGCGQMDVLWGSNYYGGKIDIRGGNVRSSGNNGTASSTNYYGGDVVLQGGVATTGGNSGGSSRTYGGSIIFKTQSGDTTANTDQNAYERMRVNHLGAVGIGTNNPGHTLHVAGNVGLGSANQYLFRPAFHYFQSYAGTSGSAYHFLEINNAWTLVVNGYNKMYIRPDSGVVLDNFTGQHRCIVDDIYSNTAVDHEGLIVCANKNSFTGASYGIKKGCEAITINESLPDVSLSNVAYDKSCYGVLSASEDPDTREDTYGTITIPIEKEVGDIRMFINSVGEGAIWVINTNGNLESGDYITTSNVVGYGMRQDDDILHNYTVAKIAMDCDFEPVTQSVKQIVKVMGTVNYWVKTTYTDINYEEYSNLTDDTRMTVSETSYSKEDSTISTDEYNALTSDIQSTYTEMTQIRYIKVNKETSKKEIIGENFELEVRQELVNVLDEHGQIQWEDDPSGATEKAYKIRYLDANGNITDEANAVHKAAFVGCTYHCG